MMDVKANGDDIGLTLGTCLMRFDGQRVRTLFEWLYERFGQLGYKPHLMEVVDRNGKGIKFRGINHARQQMSEKNWDDCNLFGLMYGEPHLRRTGGAFSWTIDAGGHPHQAGAAPQFAVPWLKGLWSVQWSVFAEWAGLDEREVIRHLIDFARLVVDDYGYLFYMKRRHGPPSYHDGFPVMRVGDFSSRNPEQIENIGAWSGRKEHFRVPLLRDIYPFNFLTRRYLDLAVYGTTLEKWIAADSSRGSVEPVTDAVAIWRPVVDNIPAIREALFRSGVMFYWRFFVDPSDTYRHVRGPRTYRLDEPIPDIFRASFYAAKDPKITP